MVEEWEDKSVESALADLLHCVYEEIIALRMNELDDYYNYIRVFNLVP